MSRLNIITEIIGGTIRLTWQSPGLTVSPLLSVLLSGSSTLVSSVTAQDSGGGYYYAHHSLPDSPGWFVNKWFGTIDSTTYVKAQYVKAISPEVD